MHKEVLGVSTHYQHIGKKGPVLFLLHGWGCSWEIWSPVISDLSKHFQLIIPDLPSFGESAQPDTTWSTQHFSAWLEEFIKKTIQDQPYFIAGHSFGGKIAAVFAAEKSTSGLQKLILIDSAGLPDPLPASKQLQEKILSLIPSSLKAAIPESMKKSFSKATGSSDDYRNASPYQRKILKTILKEDFAAQLAQINVPTLIIWGKNDQDTPFSQGQRFHQLIKNSELKAFEDTAHFPFIEQPKQFVESVVQYLS